MNLDNMEAMQGLEQGESDLTVFKRSDRISRSPGCSRAGSTSMMAELQKKRVREEEIEKEQEQKETELQVAMATMVEKIHRELANIREATSRETGKDTGAKLAFSRVEQSKVKDSTLVLQTLLTDMVQRVHKLEVHNMRLEMQGVGQYGPRKRSKGEEDDMKEIASEVKRVLKEEMGKIKRETTKTQEDTRKQL